MSAITPIPTTRVSDSLVQQRLLTQLRSDQADLFRLQTSLSTGRRIQRPSDDAPAAQRGMALQGLLERKQQVRVNLSTSQSYLGATDSALSLISGVLNQVRADALGVADTVSTPEAKRAVAEQVDRAVQQLVDTGNQKFRGRYLFSGAQTSSRPFEMADGLVRYQGDESRLLSYSDIDVLFASNLHGQEAFGALSGEVRSSVNLNPALAASTRLADLRGGRGISTGSIAVSDGATTSIIDVSRAETIGDLVALLQGNPPTGRTVTATVNSTGLEIQIDAAVGDGLTIKEVGGGTTAAELGILTPTGVGTGPVVGSDLDPRLTLTTPLSSFGTAFDQASGLQVTNGGRTYTLSFAGVQTVEGLLNVFNGAGAGLRAEINAAGTGIDVRSRTSGADFAIGENGGTTATDLGIRSFTEQTRLEDLNLGLGIHPRDGTDFQVRRKDGRLLAIDVSQAQTIGDVLALINGHPDNPPDGEEVVARLATYGNGIELWTGSTATAASFAVLKVNNSQAAEDLGLVPKGKNSSAPAVAGGGGEMLTGRDVNPLEVEGIFTALIRLRDALHAEDLLQVGRALELLDHGMAEMNFSRAEVGARQQELDLLAARLENEELNMNEALSLDIDTDFVAVVSQMTARQTAFQASLQLAARTFQLTLLDYL